MLELDDIQSGALQGRPSPYAGVYILLRIDDRRAGRDLLRRLIPALANATNPSDRSQEAWVSVALTFQGLKALGVPQDSLASFPLSFQQGMAARADLLGDIGENAPENWEKPLGTSDVHVAICALAPDTERLEAVLARARNRIKNSQGHRHLAPGLPRVTTEKKHRVPMASAIRQSKAVAFPDRIPKTTLQGGRVHPGLPG